MSSREPSLFLQSFDQYHPMADKSQPKQKSFYLCYKPKIALTFSQLYHKRIHKDILLNQIQSH